MNKKELTITGRNAPVDFIGHATLVPAKIDTGADSSSIWASNVWVDEHGTLRFVLFDIDSKWYTGEVIERKYYHVALVRSTSGHEQIRYRVEFSIRIAGRRIRTVFNLSDRSRNRFPVLIGVRTLKNKFIVDVSKAHYKEPDEVSRIEDSPLNQELRKNRYEFYRKYYSKDIQ